MINKAQMMSVMMTLESEAPHWYSQAVKSCGKVARILSLAGQ